MIAVRGGRARPGDRTQDRMTPPATASQHRSAGRHRVRRDRGSRRPALRGEPRRRSRYRGPGHTGRSPRRRPRRWALPSDTRFCCEVLHVGRAARGERRVVRPALPRRPVRGCGAAHSLLFGRAAASPRAARVIGTLTVLDPAAQGAHAGQRAALWKLADVVVAPARRHGGARGGRGRPVVAGDARHPHASSRTGASSSRVPRRQLVGARAAASATRCSSSTSTSSRW